MAGRLIPTNQEVEEQVEVDVVEQEGEDVEAFPMPEFIGEDGQALLFPGGPTLDQIEEWRSRYKDIFLTELEEGDVFIWRTLVRKEYKEVMKIQGADNYYKEERICERVMLYPQNFSFMAMASGKAGVPTLIAELVMEKSGFQAKTGAMRL